MRDFISLCNFGFYDTFSCIFSKSFLRVFLNFKLSELSLSNEIWFDGLVDSGYSFFLSGGTIRNWFLDTTCKDPDFVLLRDDFKEVEFFLSKFGVVSKHPYFNNQISLVVDNKKFDFVITDNLFSHIIDNNDFVVNCCYVNMNNFDDYFFHKDFFKHINGKLLEKLCYDKYEDQSFDKRRVLSDQFFRGVRLGSSYGFMLSDNFLKYYRNVKDSFFEDIDDESFFYNSYYSIQGEFFGQIAEQMINEELFDLFVEKYVGNSERIKNSNYYNSNCDVKKRFFVSDQDVIYGPFKSKGWFGFFSIDNFYVSFILDKVKELIPKEFRAHVASSVLYNELAWDIDISITGRFDSFLVKKVLSEIVSVGFKYHVSLDCCYVSEEFFNVEKQGFSEKEFIRKSYIPFNNFSSNGSLRMDILDKGVYVEGLFMLESVWPFDKHQSKLKHKNLVKPYKLI